MKKLLTIIVGYVSFMVLAFLVMAFGINNPDEVLPVVSEVSQEENEKHNEQQNEQNEKTEDPPKPELGKVSLLHIDRPDIGPTTVKGGLGDEYQYINEQAKKEGYIFSGKTLETSTFNMKCEKRRGYLHLDLFAKGTMKYCTRVVVYFKEDPSTVQEAFTILKDHLPTNAVLFEEYEKDEATYLYKLKQDTLGEKYYRFYEYYMEEKGTFYIIFKIRENKVHAAIIDLGPPK
ncbi:hypothetical protein IM538_04830 [Cytobacillus suaedae]|nr:hypothetical protein IM538_04830 [Cytobacillus suaedae]